MSELINLKHTLANLEYQRGVLNHKIMDLKLEIIKIQRSKFQETGFMDSMPVTADDWQLYTSSMKCAGAAKRLTSRLKQELARMAKQAQKIGIEAATKECYKAMSARLSMEAHYGAADSEPRQVLEQAILDHGRALGYDMDPEWVW